MSLINTKIGESYVCLCYELEPSHMLGCWYFWSFWCVICQMSVIFSLSSWILAMLFVTGALWLRDELTFAIILSLWFGKSCLYMWQYSSLKCATMHRARLFMPMLVWQTLYALFVLDSDWSLSQLIILYQHAAFEFGSHVHYSLCQCMACSACSHIGSIQVLIAFFKCSLKTNVSFS